MILAKAKQFGCTWLIAALLLCSWIGVTPAADQPSAKEVPTRGESIRFDLPAEDGLHVTFPSSDESIRWTVICFLGAECPLARLYGPRLDEMARQFAHQGVQFIGVNSNQQDSAADVAAYRKAHEIRFPIGKDFDNILADKLSAKRTPEAIVVDSEGRVQYRGCIDDQHLPGKSRPQITRHHLRIALEELVAGKAVSVPRTEPVGCLIGRVTTNTEFDSKTTYCDQVVRVFQRHCVECHRAGEIGPFALTDYEEVLGWGPMILEVIDDGRMPPWHANPNHGSFKNARVMLAEDKQILREWIAAGMPYGDPGELPGERQFAQGWNLERTPDLIVEMSSQPFQIPAQGTVEYQYFVVDPKLQEDKWVHAAQFVPGNRSVVHHGIVFVRPPDGAEMRGIGWLSAYVPGQRRVEYAPGHARRIPAGSKFVFQMHYTPNGKPQADLSKVGIQFIDESEVTHEVITLIGINQDFEIPPGAANHVVRDRVRYWPADGELLAAAPHMHLRGKSFRLFANRSGMRSVLLDVPRYDFNWQHGYEFAEPLSLSEIDQLEFEVAFDNSDQNPANPDPTEYVSWGDQTWEEMAVAFFDVAQPHDRPAAITTRNVNATNDRIDGAANNGAANEAANGISNSARKTRINRFVDELFRDLDPNRDNVIEKGEVQNAFELFSFYLFDLNQDSRITRQEATRVAQDRNQ